MTEENYPQYLLELEQYIGRFFRTMKERHVDNAAYVNMSTPQFYCLWVISKHDKFKMSDLANHLSLSYASATNLVNRLSDADLVNRYDDPDDRRVVIVEVNEKGREVTEMIRKKLLDALMGKCQALSEEQRNDMIKGFECLVNIMEQIKQ